MAAEDTNAAPTAKPSTAQWGLIALRMNAQPCRARRRLSAGLAVAVADLIEARFIVRLAGSCSLGYRFWRPVATFRQPLDARSSLKPTLRLGAVPREMQARLPTQVTGRAAALGIKG